MIDDLGKDWVSCYGADDIKTPHIDALAEGGMKFSNAYSMGSCTPSRTTLLTVNTHTARGGSAIGMCLAGESDISTGRKKENTTFARLMKEAGYATCAAGKWQINDFRVEPHALKKHGFDDWACGPASRPATRRATNAITTPTSTPPRSGSRTYAGKFGPTLYTSA